MGVLGWTGVVVVVWAVVALPLAVAVGRAFAAGWDDDDEG